MSDLLSELKRHREALRARPAPAAAAPAHPALSVRAPPSARPSFVRRHWSIFPVGAVVLAGAAVGIYFAVRPGVDCGAAPLGCLDASHRLQ